MEASQGFFDSIHLYSEELKVKMAQILILFKKSAVTFFHLRK
jgi:hypothetical protein